MSNDSSSHNVAPRPWGIPASILVAFTAVIITQPIAAIIVSLYPALAGWDNARTDAWFSDSSIATFINILIFELLGIGIVALFVTYKRFAFKIAIALRRIQWRDVGFGIAGFMAYLGLAMVVLTVLPLVLPVDPDQEQAIGFATNGGALTLALAFVGLVILPPIVEELIFRGFLYGTLRSKRIGVVWATLITSLLFGAPHLLTGTSGLLWIGFADTFLLSLVLCYVREETGGIWASILVHALKNGLVFLNLFVISAS